MQLRIFPVLLICLISSTTWLSADLTRHPYYPEFSQKVVENGSHSQAELKSIFQKIESQGKIIEIMDRPAESWDWRRYRENFLNQERIDKGVAFWHKHKKLITKLSRKYQVNPLTIVAILGVETSYGERQGSYKVVEALATLAFDYPRRRNYFSGELVEFLRFTKSNKLSPFSVLGSYAGATGIPQFMPTSIKNFAKDEDKIPGIDLNNSFEDAMASVANYLAKHRWVFKAPSYSDFRIVDKKKFQAARKYFEYDLNKPSKTVAYFEKTFGIKTYINNKNLKALPVRVPGERLILATSNLYAISRYNPRIAYSLVVAMLANRIKARIK